MANYINDGGKMLLVDGMMATDTACCCVTGICSGCQADTAPNSVVLQITGVANLADEVCPNCMAINGSYTLIPPPYPGTCCVYYRELQNCTDPDWCPKCGQGTDYYPPADDCFNLTISYGFGGTTFSLSVIMGLNADCTDGCLGGGFEIGYLIFQKSWTPSVSPPDCTAEINGAGDIPRPVGYADYVGGCDFSGAACSIVSAST